MTARQHLKAALCFAAITLNVAFWALLLLSLLPARAAPRTRSWFRRCGARFYRAAVRVDNVLLRRISGAAWRARELRLDPERPHIVVSNHRSWADVFLIQSLIAARGPIVAFLCKRELLYLPIVNLIIVAFDFPVLRRRTRPGGDAAGRRADDRRRVTEAAAALLDCPAAILSFAEGTRFTAARRAAADAPYEHLLPPRAGGLNAMIEALGPGAGLIVDVTLAYPRPATFWQFLGGAAGLVEVAWETAPISSVITARTGNWLNDRWRRKDEALKRIL